MEFPPREVDFRRKSLSPPDRKSRNPEIAPLLYENRTFMRNVTILLSGDTPGGGGFGPAPQRDRQLVRRDLANGLISHHAAVGDYALTDG